MIKLSIALLLFSTSLLSANPVADRQESMRDYNKLMRAANNLIRDSVINDDLAGIYEEIEEIMNFLNDEFIDNAWINFGIQHDKSIDGIFVDVFVAETWNEPLINDSSNIFDSQRELLQQIVLAKIVSLVGASRS